MQKLVFAPWVPDQSTYWAADTVNIPVSWPGRRLASFDVKHQWNNPSRPPYTSQKRGYDNNLVIRAAHKDGTYLTNEVIIIPWENALDIADAIRMLTLGPLGRLMVEHERATR